MRIRRESFNVKYCLLSNGAKVYSEDGKKPMTFKTLNELYIVSDMLTERGFEVRTYKPGISQVYYIMFPKLTA